MRKKMIFVLIITALVFFAPGSVLSAAAQNPQPGLPKTADSGNGSGEYLILFSIPPLSPEDVPAGIGPHEAETYAARIVARQAEQLQPELERYLTQGQLSLVAVRPDRNGMLVQVKDAAILTPLAHLPGVQGVYSSAKSVTCSGWSARDLKLALQAGSAAAPQLAPLAAAATDPVINIYHHAGGNWGQIYIKTTASIPVSMRLLRSGVVVGTGSGTAYSDGSYTFYPSSGSCDLLSDWDLYDGDTVEVTAHGSTVSTVVTPLDAWLNPTANNINGVTAASRQVKIELDTYASDPCVAAVNTSTVTSNTAGVFSKGYSDFNRRAIAIVWVLDANGNSTYANIRAYHIEAGIGWNSIDIYWKTNDAVTLTLSRGGGTLYTWNWTIQQGYDYIYFSLPSGDWIKAGDVIALSSAIGSMSYAVTPFSMSIDPATDKISGTAGPNRLIDTHIYRNYYSTCTSSGCLKTTANSSGAYSFSTALGLGDEVDVYTYDGEGNMQYGGWKVTPFMMAEIKYNDVGIRWLTDATLTVTLKDSSNSVKQTLTGIDFSTDDWMDWAYFDSATMVPGDHIEVTDGVTSLTMTVQALAPRLNTSTARLAGSSGNGHLKAILDDYRYGNLYYQSYCQETNVTTGSYSLAFSGSQIGPQDSGELYLTGPDGNFTYSSAIAFTLYLFLGSSYFDGYTETHGAAVTANLKRGGNVIATDTPTSDSHGLFEVNFSPEVTQVGDVVVVTTNEGSSATLTLPNLTIQADGPGNRLYGIAPANAPFSVSLWIDTSYWNSYGAEGMTKADASGNYSFSTVGLLNFDCQPVVPGAICTNGEARYSFPSKEHVLYSEIHNSEYVSPDSFEADDTYDTAQAITGLQHHTFHAAGDVDWVKFDVLQSDVDSGVKFLVRTLNLGPGMDTILELYDADGTTLLVSNDDAGDNTLASQIEWTPSAAGTYFVKVLPIDDYYTRYCGAFYDLSLLAQRSHAYLPQLTK